MFAAIRKRIDEVEAAPAKVGVTAAARIQAKLRADSTTRRGNVPSFGKFGDVESVAEGSASEIRVTGAGWVIDRAKELGQVEEWRGIVGEEAVKAFRGGA